MTITPEELDYIRTAAVGDMLGDSKELDKLSPAATVFRLCRELELARKHAVTMSEVAAAAWEGEIPSPLPGHVSSEEKMEEMFDRLNCPFCGGSGHVDDCDEIQIKLLRERDEARAQRRKKMNLTKEERDQWRERLLSSYTCFDAEHATFTIRLLNALNQAEEEIARLEQEVFFWREETKDVRELFTRQLGYKDAEIARLEREADVLSIWLTNAYIDIDLLPEIDSGAMNPPLPEDVREAAREAVEKKE